LRDGRTGSPFVAGALPVTMKLDSTPATTIYARHGDWFVKLLALITLIIIACGLSPWLRDKMPARSGKTRSWTA